MASLRQRVRTLLRVMDMGPTEFARQAGIEPSQITRLLQGSDVRTSTLIKVANGFGVSVDYLVGLTDEKARHNSTDADYSVLTLLREQPQAIRDKVVSYTEFVLAQHAKDGHVSSQDTHTDKAQRNRGNRGSEHNRVWLRTPALAGAFESQASASA